MHTFIFQSQAHIIINSFAHMANSSCASITTHVSIITDPQYINGFCFSSSTLILVSLSIDDRHYTSHGRENKNLHALISNQCLVPMFMCSKWFRLSFLYRFDTMLQNAPIPFIIIFVY